MRLSISSSSLLLTLAATVAAPAPSAAASARVAAADSAELIDSGDEAWARRAEGSRGARAAAGPIAEALTAYDQALRLEPRNLEARWKLLRALYFQGEFVSRDEAKTIFERGKAVAEESLELLADRTDEGKRLDRMSAAEAAAALAGIDEAAPVFFWSAVNWGLWGENIGRLKAARTGVGGKLRDFATTVIALDEDLENAGGRRLLGRLHAVAPKVLFFTGWVDRERALDELSRAAERGPAEPYNHFYLAEAILDHRPAERARALRMLEEIVRRPPRDDHRVEDLWVAEQARRRLMAEG